MKKTDLAYFAGVFDGEGCIVIHSRTYKLKTGKERTMYYLEVSVCNMIEWLPIQFKFAFGGTYYHRADRIWAWEIASKKAAEFLKVILPYLKLKRAQAEIGIKFEERKRRHGHEQYPEEEWAWREAQKILISNLNKRKPNALDDFRKRQGGD